VAAHPDEAAGPTDRRVGVGEDATRGVHGGQGEEHGRHERPGPRRRHDPRQAGRDPARGIWHIGSLALPLNRSPLSEFHTAIAATASKKGSSSPGTQTPEIPIEFAREAPLWFAPRYLSR